MVVIGAGVGGLYALYRLRELGFRVQTYEEADGIGGTWYWNRYPGCRFDTESPVYSYSFSDELLQEWDWTEMYSAQPDNERYLNYVADKFDLRRDIALGARVESLVYDEARDHWVISLGDGRLSTARFVMAAVGLLSTHYTPDLPGLDDFDGVWVHTGRWPKEGIDLFGKRVAVIGTGATGVQVVPEVAKVASRVVVFQRTATYCAPLKNRPIKAEEMRGIKADYRELFRICAENGTGRYPARHPRSAYDFTKEERLAYYDERWQLGHIGVTTMLFREVFEPGPINDEFSEWFKDKIREQVEDPTVAEKLVPDHRYGSRRVPGETDYYRAFNRDNVQLVSLREDPIERITGTGIQTRDDIFEFDVIIFATGWDVITGPLLAMDMRGIGGLPLKEKFAHGFRHVMQIMCAGFPNLFLVSGSIAGSYTRSIEPIVDWLGDMICFAHAQGVRRIQPTAEAEEAWMKHVVESGSKTLIGQSDSYWTGANIPGKPRVLLTASPFEGELGMRKRRAESAANGYPEFELS